MEEFFGRKKESEQLGQVFARLQRGRFEQAMVIGEAGVGKTALVRQLALVAEQKQGCFVFGKADLRRAGTTPLAPVRAALEMMVKKIIADHPDNMAIIAEGVMNHIGDDLEKAVSLIPALAVMFDDTAIRDEDRRPEDECPYLNNLLYSVIEAFTPHTRGLILFLDDLQWLDAASHKFLAHLALAPALPGVFLVLGFRCQDANQLPGLSETQKLFQSLDTCLTLEMKGLLKRDITAFLKNRLDTRQDVKTLCELCYEKTHGNPLYLNQLIDDLLEHKVVEKNEAEWIFDIPSINDLGFSENVADLIISRLRLLAEDELTLLKFGACIEGAISVEVLSAVTGFGEQKIETLFWNLLGQKIIDKDDQEYNFSHDKILEAVDELIIPEERVEIHKMLTAFYLVKNLGSSPNVSVFNLLHHYGFYSEIVTDPDLRENMVPYFLTAGQLAKERTAYAEALDWLKKGIAHFPGEIWYEDYAMALSFYSRAVECAYLSGNFEATEQMLAQVDKNAHSFDDRFAVEMVKILYYQSIDKLELALETGINILNHFGVKIPANPSWPRVGFTICKTWALLAVSRGAAQKGKQIPKQGRIYQIVRVISVLGGVAFHLSGDKFMPYIISLGLEYTLRYGNSTDTPLQYIAFGLVLNRVTGSVTWGKKLSAASLEIKRERGSDSLRGKEMFLSTFFLNHWDRSMPESIAACEKGKQICLRLGDHEYYAYHTTFSLKCMLINGFELDKILAKTAEEKTKLERLNNQRGLTVLAIQTRTFNNLKQGHLQPWDLGKDLVNIDQLSKREKGLLNDFAFYRFCAVVYCGRYDAAVKIKQETAPIIEKMAGSLLYCYYRFLAAIADIDQGQSRKTVKKHLKILKWYAANNPNHYQSWYLLAQGEYLRVRGDLTQAEASFETAHEELDKKPDALFEKALVLEKLGRVAEARNDKKTANGFLQDAIVLYRKWGLKWRHGLFEAVTTGRPRIHLHGQDRIGQPTNTESILCTIQDISRAKAVHAVILEARQWKSILYADKGGINHPAVFIDLPQKMLGFAAASGKMIRAVADDTEEAFFDTDYFFRYQPESLLVIPGGPAKGICIENPEKDVDIDRITGLAAQVFEILKPDVTDPDLPEKDPQTLMQLKACCHKLQNHMQQTKAYRDPKLNRFAVAKALELSPRKISNALNTCLGQNFQVFVNTYRVEAVKDDVKQMDVEGKNLLDIALVEGFSSKSSFNRTFKKHTGMTPSQYRKTKVV